MVTLYKQLFIIIIIIIIILLYVKAQNPPTLHSKFD